jgi:arylsulfatase
MYGVMAEIMAFATTFKEYPPRSIPPSFNPATIMDEVMSDIRALEKFEKAFPKAVELLDEKKAPK